MLVHVLVAVVLVAFEGERRQLGQHAFGESRLDEQPDAAARRPREQQLRQLVAHSLGRDAVDLGREVGHGLLGRGLDREPELGREACGTEHPQRIVAERLLGSRRGAQHPGHEVLHAARRVDELELRQAQREGVDREVPACEVVFEARAEHDLGLARCAVVRIGAVGRDLDGLAGDLRADRAERAADVPVGLCDGLHDREDLVGRGIRREVEVVDRPAEERVAHRTADEGELVPGGLERGCQPRNGRRSGQLAQPVEGCRDTLHAPMLSVRRRMARPAQPEAPVDAERTPGHHAVESPAWCPSRTLRAAGAHGSNRRMAPDGRPRRPSPPGSAGVASPRSVRRSPRRRC